MLRRLGKKLTNNFGLKILAALSAVILWVVVINIDDPVKVLQYTTSVTYENTNYITSQDKYYEVLDGDNTVTFKVSAKRTLQEKMSNSDFTAVADMEKIEYDEKTGQYRVPVVITTSKYSSDKVTISSNHYKEVRLEDLGQTRKQILPNTKGTVADGCALGTVEINASNLLKISGPSSIVSRIDTAVATINVDGMSTDVTDSVVPVLYDAEGNVIDTTKLTLSINTVSITAQILNTKDVTLEFLTKGTPAEDYVMTGIVYKPEKVRIKGEAAVLNPINKITIPKEVLDLTGASSDIDTVVDISAYLPEGISLVLNSDAKVNVTVKIEPLETRMYHVPVSNLTFENLREGYTVQFDEETFDVEIVGAASAMELLEEKDIIGAVDASGTGRGEHRLKVKLHLDEELYKVKGAVSVPVTISGTAVSRPADNATDNNAAGGGSSDAGTGDNSTGSTTGESNSSGDNSTGNPGENNPAGGTGTEGAVSGGASDGAGS